MDRHGKLPVKEAKSSGHLVVVDLVHSLDLDEMVTRTQRAQLRAAPLLGPGADRRGIGTRHGTALLQAFQVLLPPISRLYGPGRTLDQDLVHLAGRHFARPATLAHSAGYVAEQRRDQAAYRIPDLVSFQL